MAILSRAQVLALRERAQVLLQTLVELGGGTAPGIARALAEEGYSGMVGHPRRDAIGMWLRMNGDLPPFYLWSHNLEVAQAHGPGLGGRTVLVPLPSALVNLLYQMEKGDYPQLSRENDDKPSTVDPRLSRERERDSDPGF